MSEKAIMVGAVAHAPKVVEIWEGIKEFCKSENCPIDFVLFSNYDAQNKALMDGFIDIAWNTPLAFIRIDLKLSGQAKMLLMRDSDIGFTSKILARRGAFKSLDELKGKTIAFGSKDSAQAALMPEHFLRLAGLRADKDYKALRFNSDVGKQGDTGTSELEVIEALNSGKADAGAVGTPFWDEIASKEAGLEAFWTSPGFSHCVFNAMPDYDESRCKKFIETLLRMDWNNPAHKYLMEMEGLTKWIHPSRDGYAQMYDAVKETEAAGSAV